MVAISLMLLLGPWNVVRIESSFLFIFCYAIYIYVFYYLLCINTYHIYMFAFYWAALGKEEKTDEPIAGADIMWDIRREQGLPGGGYPSQWLYS